MVPAIVKVDEGEVVLVLAGTVVVVDSTMVVVESTVVVVDSAVVVVLGTTVVVGSTDGRGRLHFACPTIGESFSWALGYASKSTCVRKAPSSHQDPNGW
jgi:hypothetical protein